MIPIGNWNSDALTLPDSLVVTASHHGGPDLSTATLVPGTQPGAPYAGKLTIPETGSVDVEVAIPGVGAGGADAVIKDATVHLNVIEGGRRESASPAPAAPEGSVTDPAAPSGEIPLVAWIAGIGALVVAVGLVLRRVLADL
jgi:hypothetical protein